MAEANEVPSLSPAVDVSAEGTEFCITFNIMGATNLLRDRAFQSAALGTVERLAIAYSTKGNEYPPRHVTSCHTLTTAQAYQIAQDPAAMRAIKEAGRRAMEDAANTLYPDLSQLPPGFNF